MAIGSREIGVVAAGTANEIRVRATETRRVILVDDEGEPIAVLSAEQAETLAVLLRSAVPTASPSE